MSVWDYCGPDPSCYVFLEELAASSKSPFGLNSSHNTKGIVSGPVVSYKSSASATEISNNARDVDGLQSSLLGAEMSCRNFIDILDTILSILDGVAAQFVDVTSRTNSLMSNAESLLEQQHTLHSTAETLKLTLAPFNDIEDIANLLGIPIDAGGKTTANSSSSSSTVDGSILDPRSPEFHAALTRLSKALSFIKDHGDFCDGERYHRWLIQLQNRATSIVARSMKELLENAAKACLDIASKEIGGAESFSKGSQSTTMVNAKDPKKSTLSRSGIDDTTPLEAAPVYQKFRGLGFRMRELSALLQISVGEEGGRARGGGGGGNDVNAYDIRNRLRNIGRDNVSSSNSNSNNSKRAVTLRTAREILSDVKQTYVSIRTSLLMPFLKETAQGIGHNRDVQNKQSNSTLCPGIRHAFSMLLRVTQLEFQLAESLFRAPTTTSSNPTNDGAGGTLESASVTHYPSEQKETSSDNNNNILEMQSIVEALSNALGDSIRPFIIHESDVDELCRVVTTLAEDVRTQMMAMPIPRILLRQLIHSLDRSISDAQERLAYCAEMRLRQDVQMFEPLPSQLAYPEILEKHAQRLKELQQSQEQPNDNTVDASSQSGLPPPVPVEDVSKTWYIPLKQTLALLSKLYGVIEMPVFEHYARRSVELCVQALKSGSEGVKRMRSPLHGDLFLVRHLLVLREQLIPFEIRLSGVEMQLDFKPTGAALSHLAQSPRSILRFDVANGLLQLAWDGLPAMKEMQVDARKNLDLVLKDACLGLKGNAVKMLLGPLDSWLSKVIAFVGDIPTGSNGNSSGNDGKEMLASDDSIVLLPAEARSSLKNQAFVRPERIKEMLDSMQSVAIQAAPDLRDIMRLYIENSVARTILLKPVQQDIELARKRTVCVIASCVDPGQMRRDLEQLLGSVISAVLSQITS